MPALVNYSVEDEFRSPRSIYSIESGLSCSQTDFYSPPSKRARISFSYPFSFEEDQTSSIDILPEECLFEIFRRLSDGQARSASACVSKHWLTILSSIRNSEISKSENNGPILSSDVDMVSDDGYLTRCLEGKKATDNRLSAIAVGTSTQLGKLSIRGNNSICGVTNIGISAIARCCPSLRVLSLWNVPLVGDKGIIEIAKECHLLEKLDLSQCPLISNKGLISIAEDCPNLTSLTIESCSRIGNESLQAIAKHCPKLQCISIKDCNFVGDKGILSLFSSASCVLTKVKLQSLKLTDYSLAVIGHYGKSLVSLSLTGLQSTSEKGFWVMGKALGLGNLSSLMISCRGITDVSLEAIGQGCSGLKHMCLRKCCFVSDNGLVAFSRATQSLESLQLEECNRISQRGIFGTLLNCKSKLKSLNLSKCMGIKDQAVEISLLSTCESLRSLSIQNCPEFGDFSLAMVGKLCPKLNNIDLSGLSNISDDGLLSLVEESSEAGLVKVNLSGCLNITDKLVSSIAIRHGGTLEMLNLDKCFNVSDESMVSIAENCFVLNELDLSKCSVSDSGIVSLSHGEQLNLQILSLSGCSKITNKSTPFLRNLGRTLVGLNLQNCKGISSSAVKRLTESLWRCDILS